MNRRDFMHIGAALAATSAGAAATARAAPARRGAVARGGASPAAAAANPPAAPAKLKIDAYSRHLQWLRSPDEVAEAVIEMGYDGLDVTVRPYPGHVDPAKVATDLPPFVEGIRKNGLQVVTITCPITDADSPNAERILATAASLGIHHYWWGTFRYDQSQPVMAQLEALKPRVAKLAKLNAKYGMKAMYHTYSGSQMVGAAVWDLMHVLREFDPAHVSLHYDIGHMTNAGGNGTWITNLRDAGPYVGGLSIKDSIFELDLPIDEGGPFTGTPAQLNSRGAFGPNGPTPAPASGPAPRASPGAGPGGPGRRSLGRGGGGQPNPWRVRQTPLGMGMVDLPRFAEVLKEINFSGPVEIQAEYPNGGAENAADKLTLPRAIVLGAMKRDLLTLKAAFGPSGLI
jgi:sugar phosphate isomerase/epimerase